METSQRYGSHLFLLAILISVIPPYNLVPHDAYFWPNFLFFWVPHVVAVGILWLMQRPSVAAATGFSLGLTVFLMLVSVAPAEQPKEGVARWLMFVSGIPFSFIASLLAVHVTRKRKTIEYFTTCFVLLGCSVAGAISGTLMFFSLISK